MEIHLQIDIDCSLEKVLAKYGGRLCVVPDSEKMEVQDLVDLANDVPGERFSNVFNDIYEHLQGYCLE